MRGMENTANTAPETTEPTVLETPMTHAAALKAMDSDGWLTAIVPVSLSALLDGRANEEAGEDYPVVNAMVEGGLEPVQMSYEVVGHHSGDVLLLKASFELREALCLRYDEDEIAELELQAS